MGRSSSRLAHKRAQVAVESEGENSEDEEEWTFPEKKGQLPLVSQHYSHHYIILLTQRNE